MLTILFLRFTAFILQHITRCLPASLFGSRIPIIQPTVLLSNYVNKLFLPKSHITIENLSDKCQRSLIHLANGIAQHVDVLRRVRGDKNRFPLFL